MLSFTSSLSPDCEAFAIFVTDKYDYKDKKDIYINEEDIRNIIIRYFR